MLLLPTYLWFEQYILLLLRFFFPKHIPNKQIVTKVNLEILLPNIYLHSAWYIEDIFLRVNILGFLATFRAG